MGFTKPPHRIYNRKVLGQPIEPTEKYGAEILLPSGKYRRIGLFASREEALKAIQIKDQNKSLLNRISKFIEKQEKE